MLSDAAKETGVWLIGGVLVVSDLSGGFAQHTTLSQVPFLNAQRAAKSTTPARFTIRRVLVILRTD